tara:strand:- start:508 stop:942 length:435 start_codon:yes stop_codon:yes gene_type:complete
MIKKDKIVEEGRISEKLDDLIQYHQELVEDLPTKTKFKNERLTKRGIEKTIEMIADLIIDISLIIISEKGFDKPDDSRDAIRVLERNKVLSKQLSAKIQDLISFRNLLVHRYGKIDDDLEYENIEDNNKDVVLFVKEIEGWLNQ